MKEKEEGWVYALLCKGHPDPKKYWVKWTVYVGWSHSENSMKSRISTHKNGKGAVWTQDAPPVTVLKTEKGDKKKELLWVREYSEIYGTDNVCGAGRSWARKPESIRYSRTANAS